MFKTERISGAGRESLFRFNLVFESALFSCETGKPESVQHSELNSWYLITSLDETQYFDPSVTMPLTYGTFHCAILKLMALLVILQDKLGFNLA